MPREAVDPISWRKDVASDPRQPEQTHRNFMIGAGPQLAPVCGLLPPGREERRAMIWNGMERNRWMKQSVTRGLGAVSGLMLLLTGVAIAGPSNRGPKPSHPRPLSGFGSPLPAVLRNPADEKIFATGQANFKEDDGIPQLGPIFNGHTSCAGCNFQGAVGGGAAINEIRVRANQQAGPVHLFAVDNATFHEPASPGCSVATSDCDLSPCQQQEEDATTFTATLPGCDPGSSNYLSGGNCQAERRTIPTFGDGLVEAVDDATLEDIAQQEPPALRGSVKFVTEDGASRVARFGWK